MKLQRELQVQKPALLISSVLQFSEIVNYSKELLFPLFLFSLIFWCFLEVTCLIFLLMSVYTLYKHTHTHTKTQTLMCAYFRAGALYQRLFVAS